MTDLQQDTQTAIVPVPGNKVGLILLVLVAGPRHIVPKALVRDTRRPFSEPASVVVLDVVFGRINRGLGKCARGQESNPHKGTQRGDVPQDGSFSGEWGPRAMDKNTRDPRHPTQQALRLTRTGRVPHSIGKVPAHSYATLPVRGLRHHLGMGTETGAPFENVGATCTREFLHMAPEVAPRVGRMGAPLAAPEAGNERRR